MFVAMNNFKVVHGRADDFETAWRTRQTYLQDVPGFQRFLLLRGDAVGEYISLSIWEGRDAFLAWTQSESFAAGHRQGSLAGILEGPPNAKLYEAVLVEGAEATARA